MQGRVDCKQKLDQYSSQINRYIEHMKPFGEALDFDNDETIKSTSVMMLLTPGQVPCVSSTRRWPGDLQLIPRYRDYIYNIWYGVYKVLAVKLRNIWQLSKVYRVPLLLVILVMLLNTSCRPFSRSLTTCWGRDCVTVILCSERI